MRLSIRCSRVVGRRPTNAAQPRRSGQSPVRDRPRPPRSDAWWQQRHEGMNARVKQGNVDLIFIGDSITHGWEGAGKEVWKKYYGKRNAVNLGIGGDQTQHVLWRLDHGNIDGISPKLAVVMIGTNNAGTATRPRRSPRASRRSSRSCGRSCRKRRSSCWPSSPAAPNNNDPLRQVNTKANEIIAKLADGKNGVLSRHRPEVPRRRRHAQQGHHARPAASQRQGLRDLGRSDRADGGEADGREARARWNGLLLRLAGRPLADHVPGQAELLHRRR